MSFLLRGIGWSAAYLALALAPLGVALLADPIPEARPFALELAVAFGFVAFALIAIEFSLVSRLRAASEPFGTDTLMLFHRHMGIAALAFLVAHTLILAWRGGSLALLGPFAGSLAARSGAVAMWSTLLLVAASVARRRLKIRYELWRLTHLLLAVLAVAAMALHVACVDRYAGAPSVAVLLALYVALFLALMVRYRLLRPLSLGARPWLVVENRPEGGDTRTLVLRPDGHDGLSFQPGQFAWLVTGRTPFRSEQHPISIASSAERAPDGRIEFSIKALGDWSRDVVPALAPGARVWVDGPFGAFTPDRAPGQGFVMIAGGIGVTPMLSMLRTMRDRKDPRPVRLVYAARNRERMVFRAELAALERELDLSVVLVFEEEDPDPASERGFITTELLRRHLPDRVEHAQVFVCGPVPMMDAVERSLAQLGVPAERVHTERFDMV